jgi:uncharacterized membrane protein YbhN (UPF0104 family)
MSVLRPEPLPGELSAGGFVRRAGGLLLVGVVVALLISTLPGLDQVRERFAHAEPVWLAALFFFEVCSCLAYVVAFRGVFCTRLGWRFSYEVGMAEQGTNVLVPAGGVGGLALGAWALRQGGMSTDRIARRSVAFFVLTSAPNFLCAALFGLALASGLLPGGGPLILTWALAGLALAAILLVAVLPRILHQVRPEPGGAAADAGRRARAGRFVRRAAVTVAEGVHDDAGLLKARQPYALFGAIGYMAFDVVALAAAFAAFGTTPPFAAFVFAYVIGQLGGLIPLPGGIGGIDGGLIGALTLYGSPLSQATAAVLAYRVVQLGIPAILGSVAFVQLRRTLVREEAPAALCEPHDKPLPVFTLPRR